MLRTALFSVLGLLELLAPRRVVDVSTRLAYDNPGDFTVKPWVVTAVRLEGLAFLLLAIRGHTSDRRSARPHRADA